MSNDSQPPFETDKSSPPPPSRYMRLKWWRRAYWIMALLFGAIIYKVVSGHVSQQPIRPIIPKGKRNAIEALAPLPDSAVFPLKKSWRSTQPVPYPKRQEERQIPKSSVPTLMLLPISFRETEKPKSEEIAKENRAHAFAVGALLRRDLELVDGISLMDFASTPQQSATDKEYRMRLGARFHRLKALLFIEVVSSGTSKRIEGQLITAQGSLTRSLSATPVSGKAYVEAARRFLKSTIHDAGGTASPKAWAHINAFQPRPQFFMNAGYAIMNLKPGVLSASYAFNPLMALAQLRGLIPAQQPTPLQTVLRNDPKNIEAFCRIMDTTPPKAGLKPVLEKAKLALSYAPQNGSIYLSRSKRYLAFGKKKEALDDALKAVSALPVSSEAYTHLARIYLRLNNPVLAQRLAEQAVSWNPKHAGAHEVLIEALQALDQGAKAIKAAESYLGQLPKHPGAQAFRVRALYLGGDYRNARAFLNSDASQLVDTPEGDLLASELLLWTGKLDVATKYIKTALAARPNNPGLRSLQKDIQLKASTKGGVHMRQTPNTVAQFRVLDYRAQITWRLGRAKTLEGIALKLYQLAANDPATLWWKAVLLRHQGKRFESLSWLEKLAGSGSPLTREATRDLVEALITHGRFSDAKKAITKILIRKQDMPQRLALTGHLMFLEGLFLAQKQNDYPKALKNFAIVMRKNKSPALIKQVTEIAEEYMKILVKAEKIEEAKKVPLKVNGPMNREQRSRLMKALARALALKE